MTDFLPCPFCGEESIKTRMEGGSDERFGYNFSLTAICMGCRASRTVGSEHDENGWCNEGPEEVLLRLIETWNRRPE